MQRLVATFFSLFMLMSIGTLPVHAQGIGASQEPLTVSMSPAYPSPYQSVSISPESTVFDIAAATISVSVNGTSIYKGTGGQAVPVTIGGPGTATTISVSATTAGKTYTKKIVVRPASVALVIEPVTTSHPFYEGRSLISAQSRVRLVAIPDIRTSANTSIPVSSLVYTWKLGEQILQNASGIGKNVLDASAPEKYRDANITVTVTTQDGSITGRAVAAIAPTDPTLRIYKNDPLMGPAFEVAQTGSVTMNDIEATYRVIPYNFATTPSLIWTVNGTGSGSDPDITVRSSGSGKGTAVLGVSAKQTNPLVTAASTISVLFGQKSTKNIFGL